MDKRNFPTCSFCQREFRIGGPAPFLLRCHHDLCGECLESLGSDNSRSDLKCLECDTIQSPNHLLKNLCRQRDILDLTARYRRSELVCKHQFENEKAVGWCPQCDRLLCITCQRSHENEQRHTIFNIPRYPVEAEETGSSDSASRPPENPVVTRTGQAAILPTNERSGTHMTIPSSKAMDGSFEVAMEIDTPKNSGSVVDPPEHKATQQQPPEKELEVDIKWWKQHHKDEEMKKENVDKVWGDLFSTRQLIERLLEERKGDFLMKRHEELKKEYSRQQVEIEKLKKSKIKPKPLVSLHILSAWQSLPVEEIARRISVVLERQKIDMRFNVVTDPAEVTINSRPLLVLCVNNSRLQTDVSNALKDIQVDDGVCLVVLHHKDQISRPVRSSQKLLSTTEFRSLGAVVDMQFWRKKEIYSCGQNGAGAEKIADYLVRYARPGFQ